MEDLYFSEEELLQLSREELIDIILEYQDYFDCYDNETED